MTDLPFIVAAYLVIVGGLALYAVTLLRRLRRARDDAAGAARERGDEST
jgi:hypothetical protein